MRWVFTVFLLLVQSSYAQIPNGSFEDWNNGNPDWWQTVNIPIVPPSIVLDSDSYTGQFSVKGIVVGDMDNHPFQPYLGIYGGGAQGFSISNSYDHFIGWFKTSLFSGDRFKGFIRFFNSNQETIADGVLDIDSSVSTWTEFNIAINYFSNDAPVSCTIYFTITDSTLLSSGHIGSYFKVDGLSLKQTVGISSPDLEEGVSVYMNQATNEVVIQNLFTDKILIYTVTDIAGRILLNGKNNSGENRLSTVNFTPGIYLVSVSLDNKRLVKKIITD